MPKAKDFTKAQLDRPCPLQLTVEEVMTLNTAMEISMLVGHRVAEGGTPPGIKAQSDELRAKLDAAVLGATK